jgi:hypothetical protein
MNHTQVQENASFSLVQSRNRSTFIAIYSYTNRITHAQKKKWLNKISMKSKMQEVSM